MRGRREPNERKKISSLASMNIVYIYLIYMYTVTSQAYMLKHNVGTARKYAHTLSLSDYIAYLNVLQIYFL